VHEQRSRTFTRFDPDFNPGFDHGESRPMDTT
jgi:hypothetical protein